MYSVSLRVDFFLKPINLLDLSGSQENKQTTKRLVKRGQIFFRHKHSPIKLFCAYDICCCWCVCVWRQWNEEEWLLGDSNQSPAVFVLSAQCEAASPVWNLPSRRLIWRLNMCRAPIKIHMHSAVRHDWLHYNNIDANSIGCSWNWLFSQFTSGFPL